MQYRARGERGWTTGDFFGVDQLVDLLGRNFAGGLPIPETMRRIVRSLLEHHEGQLGDDAALLLAEWHGGPDIPPRP